MKNINNRLTIYDIAKESGMSVGTVNRALNNKPRINPETKQRILEIAERMGYQANNIARSLRRNPIQIGVVLNCPVKNYLSEIKRGMDSSFNELREYNVFGEYTVIVDVDTDEYIRLASEALEKYHTGGYDGIITFLSGNNTVFSDKIKQIIADDIPVATVGTDIMNCSSVISVHADGNCAGRLAAELLHLCCGNGKVAILTGSINTKIHRDNIDGFYTYAETHPFESVNLYEHQDNAMLVELMTERMINDCPGLSGIYITSATAPIACRKIYDMGYKGIKIVTTDLFAETRELLGSGIICATIFQDPYRQGKEAVRRLYNYICNNPPREDQFLVIPQLILSSNMNIYPVK